MKNHSVLGRYAVVLGEGNRVFKVVEESGNCCVFLMNAAGRVHGWENRDKVFIIPDKYLKDVYKDDNLYLKGDTVEKAMK